MSSYWIFDNKNQCGRYPQWFWTANLTDPYLFDTVDIGPLRIWIGKDDGLLYIAYRT